MSKLTLERLQEEHVDWTLKNFPLQKSYQCFMGIVEELGDLAHAHLKEEQNIRGTKEQNIEKAKDAVGDIVIFLAGYCSSRGFKFQEIVEAVWAKVKKRDYKNDESLKGG